ncbi:MAG: fumarate hydratase, partial [Alphaproteobacteria bacterium]
MTSIPKLFPLGDDDTLYRLISKDYIGTDTFRGHEILILEAEGLRLLSEAAFSDINHFLRPGHLQQLRNILDDPEASDNDRYVALSYLKNASISAGGVLPMCQDTGTAIIMGKRGQAVWVNGDDASALGQGVLDAYEKNNLRYSQLAPITMFKEVNTRNNLPAQVDLMVDGFGAEYQLHFMSKGGGSANKSFLFQATPSMLSPERLIPFLDEKIRTLGTAACPPYHLAIVIGGLSAEQNMKTVKLASARYYDTLPAYGSNDAHAFRDLDMEQTIL